MRKKGGFLCVRKSFSTKPIYFRYARLLLIGEV